MQTLVEVLVELEQLGASEAPARLTRIAARFTEPRAQGRTAFDGYLAGDAAYVRVVEPARGQRWVAEVDRLLGGTDG